MVDISGGAFIIACICVGIWVDVMLYFGERSDGTTRMANLGGRFDTRLHSIVDRSIRSAYLDVLRRNENRNRQMSSAWRVLLEITRNTEFAPYVEDAVEEVNPAFMIANTLRDNIAACDKQMRLAQQVNRSALTRVHEYQMELVLCKRMISVILKQLRAVPGAAEEVLTLEQLRILDALTKMV